MTRFLPMMAVRRSEVVFLSVKHTGLARGDHEQVTFLSGLGGIYLQKEMLEQFTYHDLSVRPSGKRM